MAHRIVFLCVDEFQLIDLAGPMDVFDTASRLRGRKPFYEIIVASVAGGALRSSSGLPIDTERASSMTGRIDSLIVIGSFAAPERLSEPEFAETCSALSTRAARLVSVCNGAFGLGAAGLLDGRRVTTHWSMGDSLALEHPEVVVDPGRIFVQDGSLFTSGGATSGIDLALALVAQDLGVSVARDVAKWLVVFLRRPGGQSQFLATSAVASGGSAPIEHALRVVADDPSADHRIETLAARVGLSRRHLSRLFRVETGTTIATHVERVRLDQAALLLESTHLDHETIARQVGFSTGEVMRQVFHRRRGISPSQHREHFSEPVVD